MRTSTGASNFLTFIALVTKVLHVGDPTFTVASQCLICTDFATMITVRILLDSRCVNEMVLYSSCT